jgi:hypothetical protein
VNEPDIKIEGSRILLVDDQEDALKPMVRSLEEGRL